MGNVAWQTACVKNNVYNISKELSVIAKLVFNLHRYDSDIQDKENVPGCGSFADLLRLKLYFQL